MFGWRTKSGGQGGAAPPSVSGEVSAISKQWRQFLELVLEPWTCLLLLVSILLFVIGQQKLDGGVTALVQILLAVSSGVLGARVTNLIAEASGQGILTARGKVAVRGLKLMLVQTAAFERRLHKFAGHREHIETNPEVTVRNYEEAIEFCKRIQEEAASAMETWGDIIPAADLSSLIGRITEAEEQRDSIAGKLAAALEKLAAAEGNAADAAVLREQASALADQVLKAEKRVAALNERLARRTSPERVVGFNGNNSFESYEQHMAARQIEHEKLQARMKEILRKMQGDEPSPA